MDEIHHSYLEIHSLPMCRPIFHKIVYSVFCAKNSIPYVLPSEELFTGSLPITPKSPPRLAKQMLSLSKKGNYYIFIKPSSVILLYVPGLCSSPRTR